MGGLGVERIFSIWAVTWCAAPFDSPDSLRDIHGEHFDSFIRLLAALLLHLLFEERSKEEVL